SNLPNTRERTPPKARFLVIGWILVAVPILGVAIVGAVWSLVSLAMPNHPFKTDSGTITIRSDGFSFDLYKLLFGLVLGWYGCALLCKGIKKTKETES